MIPKVTSVDIDEAVRRLDDRRNRIEGAIPPEFQWLRDRLAGTVFRPLVAWVVLDAVAFEREHPSMRSRMLADEAMHLALRVGRLEIDTRAARNKAS